MSPDRPPALPVEPDLTGAVRRIIELQSENGRIVWFEDGPWDPWNHVECAMALAAAGETTRAARAYDYLAATQRPDGAWLGEYGNALPMRDRDHISRVAAPAFLDTNFCAYPAVGILHFLLLTGDEARVRSWWPMVRAAMDFVIALQRDDGTISWAFEAVGQTRMTPCAQVMRRSRKVWNARSSSRSISRRRFQPGRLRGSS